MYFTDLLESNADRASCNSALEKFAVLVRDAVDLLAKGWKVAEAEGWKEQLHHHVTVQMLTRHVCESLDGISVLAAKGCAEPSKPLLRSAFEAMLGVQYILEADSERRGIAYQIAHAHRRISLYRKMDPNEPAGKQLRKELADDSLFVGMELPKEDFQQRIANLERMFARPEFAPVEAEWQAKRHKSDPAWFSLFSGPNDVRTLALRLKHGAMYEFLYRHWSNAVHAGDCFANIAPGENGTKNIRPLRHPEGLQSMVVLAVGICLAVNRTLLDRYATNEQKEAAQAEYAVKIQKRHQELHGGDIINAPWR